MFNYIIVSPKVTMKYLLVLSELNNFFNLFAISKYDLKIDCRQEIFQIAEYRYWVFFIFF